jgi:hypothetical protein
MPIGSKSGGFWLASAPWHVFDAIVGAADARVEPNGVADRKPVQRF